MKKKLILMLVVAVVAMSCVFIFLNSNAGNINSPAEESTKYLIGMSQCNLIEPWKVEMNREIEREGAQHPDLKIIFTDAAGDSQKQKEDVKMLMEYGIDILIISPNDSHELNPIISEVYQQIPVIVLDPKIYGKDFTMFIGPDNEKIGMLAARLLSEKLGEEGGNIIEIIGSENSSTTQERRAGFQNEIAGQKNIAIIAELCGNWMRDEAEDRLKEYIIVEQPDFDAVFAQSDAMAEGAFIGNDKLRYKSTAMFFGVGGQGNKDMKFDGGNSLTGTIYCPTGGKQAIQYAIAILNNEENLPKELIFDPEIIATE